MADEIVKLLVSVYELIADAERRKDPSKLRRVKEVIRGELETESVLRAGEREARLLAGEG